MGKKTAALLLLLTLTAPARAAMPAQPTDTQILHLLNRATFGPAPGDIAVVRGMGIESWLDAQLQPRSLPLPDDLRQRLDALPTLSQSMPQLAAAYALPRNIDGLPEEERKQLRRRQNAVVEDAAQAKLLRAVASPAQLQEVMVDFWYNHFNVFADKGPDKFLVGAYERDAIRPYALGNFAALLSATAHHPAMLVYLDNAQNSVPREGRDGKKTGINENYARELMELHTLGVDGGYSQADVTTLAHILTGWGVGAGPEAADHARFFFEPRRHDFASYNWLGYAIRGGGAEEVESVLQALAHHPATAHHIAYELAQYFVADAPPDALVKRLSAVFLDSDGDIAATLRALFRSPEFWEARNDQQKFKPPFRYVVSSLRAAGAVPPGDTKQLQAAIARMGEPLYRCLAPNGYAAANDQWLNSDALLKRIEFSKALTGFFTADADEVIGRSRGENWEPQTLAAVRQAAPRLRAALLLSSPNFLYY